LSISEEQGILVSGSMDGSLALWEVEPFHTKEARLPEVEGILAHNSATSGEDPDEESADQMRSTAENGSQETEISSAAYCSSVVRMTFQDAEGKLATFPIGECLHVH
jgi:hypothetical protein